VTVASCKSLLVTEDILVPVKSHKPFEVHAGPTLLDLIEIAELRLRLQLLGGGGGFGHCWGCWVTLLHVQRMLLIFCIFYFGIFTCMADVLS
jgi:hypothetical protein